ncbi:MAG TPA: DEAD/DEAH box helicase [Terracidiphilus sp.]|nr:DEAD/DEAH box helicase [Terracidiphilus sp.]
MAPLPPQPEIQTDIDPLACFHPVTAEWFRAVFDAPTAPQRLGWPVIARRESALILAPTGTGKTLTAFLWCLDRLMLHGVEANAEASGQPPKKPKPRGCRIVYISPLKALAVDVERNLRSPLAGIANMARRRGVPFRDPAISVRTGDTPQRERARFRRQPADILITTPESLYLLLTSQAADALRSVDTVIIDEIHSLVPTKRGAHLALSLERLQGPRQPFGSRGPHGQVFVRREDSAHRALCHAAPAGGGGALSRRCGYLCGKPDHLVTTCAQNPSRFNSFRQHS